MNINPIKSEADYDKVLAIIDGLMGTAPTSSECRLTRRFA